MCFDSLVFILVFFIILFIIIILFILIAIIIVLVTIIIRVGTDGWVVSGDPDDGDALEVKDRDEGKPDEDPEKDKEVSKSVVGKVLRQGTVLCCRMRAIAVFLERSPDHHPKCTEDRTCSRNPAPQQRVPLGCPRDTAGRRQRCPHPRTSQIERTAEKDSASNALEWINQTNHATPHSNHRPHAERDPGTGHPQPRLL